jgi:hypothetical protein
MRSTTLDAALGALSPFAIEAVETGEFDLSSQPWRSVLM